MGRERDDDRRNVGNLCQRGRLTRVDELPSVTALINVAATGTRRLTPDELRRVLEHVAQAGFDPDAQERAGGRLAGTMWRGRILRGSDPLSPSEAHYLRHVERGQEWPTGTTLQDYFQSIRDVVRDSYSGVITSQFQGASQLTIVRRTGDLQGTLGFPWILIDYRVATGYWTTAFQPRKRLAVLRDPKREDIVWLRRPRSRAASSGA